MHNFYHNKNKKERSNRLPLRTHISYKPQESPLLDKEEDLMDHYSMNRSDTHKHLIRTSWSQIFGHKDNLVTS